MFISRNQEDTECRFKVALLNTPPYIMSGSLDPGFMYQTIKWFVDMACFSRQASDPTACNMDTIFARSQDEMSNLMKTKQVDFTFPFQANHKIDDDGLPNVTLIRAFVSFGSSLIANLKKCEEESEEQLFASITSQWPILVCMMLLSGVSGILVWLLERRVNKDQFSPLFTAGAPQGFWWAVLSLTTVGYGDVTPKSFLGRIFGIIWVLVGAVMMSLFTGLIISAMQASLDGTKCKDIAGKEVGVLAPFLTTQKVAEEFDAKIIKFDSLQEMQKNLSQGAIGRVLLDHNTALYFLDKFGSKQSRQIRMIRNIDYPMEYYLGHVSHDVTPLATRSPNETNYSEEQRFKRKQELSRCGKNLKELSTDLVAVAKETAKEQLIPAELQSANLSDEMEGFFSSGSKMTLWMLIYLLAVFLGLVFLGILLQVYSKCYQARVHAVTEDFPHCNDVSENPRDRHVADMMQYVNNLEERLKDSIAMEIQRLKEEMNMTIPGQETPTSRN
nr:uncharacterized protein LOC131780509 [Pocillopora verrucosa]